MWQQDIYIDILVEVINSSVLSLPIYTYEKTFRRPWYLFTTVIILVCVYIPAVCDIHCLNGGKCVVDGDAESCLCPANYVGKHCEDYRKFAKASGDT